MSAGQQAELEGALLEDPEDAACWLAYADWLQQRGDARGELIALDVALETSIGARRAELEARRKELLEEQAITLLGEPFAGVVKEGYGQVVWRRGFVDSLSYVGDPRLGHRRAVGWVVKLLADRPHPFLFVRKLVFRWTDLADLTPFARYPLLREIDVTGCSVQATDELEARGVTIIRR